MDFDKIINIITTGDENKRLNVTEGSTRPCKICGNTLQAIELKTLIGSVERVRWVIPHCKCEKEKVLNGRKEIEQATEKNRIRNLFSINDIGSRYLHADFENFEKLEGTDKVFKVAQNYALRFTNEQTKGLMFYGNTGNGKTMLAACIHNHLKVRGHTVVFVSVPTLLSKIKNSFNSDSEVKESQIMKALVSCDLLILDDLGAEKKSDWVHEKMFAIVDERYKREKPIVCTTNVNPKFLGEQIGDRALDRLLEMTYVYQNEGKSYRRRKLLENMKTNEFED